MDKNEKQIRKLREQADKARQTGNSRKALEVYHELCQAEPGEPRWPQLCGELHRKLGQLQESVEHFVAAAQIYKTQGFDVKAVAMCKVVLGLDPLNAQGLTLLEEITSSPRRSAESAVGPSLARAPAGPSSQPGMAPGRAAGSPQTRATPASGDAFAAAPRAQAQPGEEQEVDPFAVGTDAEDSFIPPSTAAPARGFGATSAAPPPRVAPSPPPSREAVPPQPPAREAAPPQLPPAREAAPAQPPPRRPTRETSPKELVALDLSELEELLGPSPGASEPGGPSAPSSTAESLRPPVRTSSEAPAPDPSLDLAIEIEGFDSVLGAPATAPTEEPKAARPPRKRVHETITLSEEELEILESGGLPAEEDDDVVVLEPEPSELEDSLSEPPARARPIAPSEEELEILDDSDLAFMEALEQSTTGEQRQPKKRPTLDPNAPLESLELKDVMPRLERLPSQPDQEELYEIELEEIEVETPPATTARPVDTTEYQKRLTPAKPPPDMTPPGLFRALGIDATKSLVTRMNYVEKKPGEVVIQQGEKGGSLYVIVRGEVRIVKELGDERVEVSRLGEGEFFGEMALVTDTPRVATVEAVTELDLLEVTRETLRLLIQDFPQVVPNLIKFLKDRLLEVFVKTSELLRPVPEKYRWQLARKFKLYEIHEGKTILREGKPSGGMFIFLAGQAVATRQRRGKTVQLAEVGPGALIGEISLLGGGAAVATVTATTKCWLLAVSQKQFEVLCQTFPQMRSFVEELAERRRQENAKLLAGDLSFVSQELRLV